MAIIIDYVVTTCTYHPLAPLAPLAPLPKDCLPLSQAHPITLAHTIRVAIGLGLDVPAQHSLKLISLPITGAAHTAVDKRYDPFFNLQ